MIVRKRSVRAARLAATMALVACSLLSDLHSFERAIWRQRGKRRTEANCNVVAWELRLHCIFLLHQEGDGGDIQTVAITFSFGCTLVIDGF